MNAQERIDTAVRNILSGNNGCGTLARAAMDGDREYFSLAVRPVVDAYEQELAATRQQRDYANRDNEIKRFALETVVSNLTLPEGPVKDAVKRALPNRDF